MVPIYNMNGGRLTFRHFLGGSWSTQAQLSYGLDKKKLNIPLGPTTIYGKNMIDGNLSITNNIWTFYTTAMWLKFWSTPFPQLSALPGGGAQTMRLLSLLVSVRAISDNI